VWLAVTPEASQSADPLRQDVACLRRVTPPRLDQLRRLDIQTVGDLLFHFPRAYEDLTDIRTIARLAEGVTQTVQGEVVEIEGRRLADGRAVVSVVVSDDGRTCLEGVWFNQPYAARRFRYGQRVSFSGKAKWLRDHWQMNNPRVQILDGTEPAATPGIVPVYPLTEELRVEQLRPLIRQAVERFARYVVEVLPADLRERHHLPDATQALHDIHFPATLAAAEAGRRRFVYEEFLVLQLALVLRRRELRDGQRAPPLKTTPQIDARIRRLFPFRLTADQDRAIAELSHDLASERPMQRLLQADVGAGKTAVAVYALLVAVANQHQAVLMAPTEVLAQQHWRTLESYLAHSRVRRLLLTGALTPRERKAALADIREGRLDLVVGTQALVQEDVQFARLGVVVVDEQHKFGVNQRARVRRLGVDPHYLVMTATPIPRTMALTVFGDLDVSTIRQLPPGRQPVKTRYVATGQRERLYAHLRDELRKGRQAYVICPLVEESETLGLKAASATHAELQAGPFRDFHLGLLHGRLDDQAKDAIMQQFRAGAIDLLVSTSVVEVGVDVPNATLLTIEHAERFGLSQLHQLRGRVSRGRLPGECYVFAEPANEEAKERLRAFVRTTDGFALAETDARLRGIGEFFGTRQHGLGELRVANVMRDAELLRLARKDAIAMVAADAGLRDDAHALLRRAVLDRYGRTLELSEVG
jgi:ATP-dependent DNA helicase RecG